MRALLILIGGLGLAVIAGGVVLYSGVINVAANEPHGAFARWLLETGMRRSVAFHAGNQDPPDLGDPALIVRGFRHFQSSCARCHGTPVDRPDPTAGAMLPAPPSLSESVARFDDNELFWIIENGLRYTGMPGWPVEGRDDEVWAVVAFVRLLPQVSIEEYVAMTSGNAAGTAEAQIAFGDPSLAPSACARCHGLDGEGDPGGAFPRLTSLTTDYILAQLDAFSTGERPSGIMRTAVMRLDDAERRLAAEYYGELDPTRPAPPDSAEPALLDRGAIIAATGLPDQGVPACLSCHQDPAAEAPPLAGQFSTYIRQQLMLFRAGARADNVMSSIAGKLNDDDVAAVAAYFATLEALP